MHAGDFQRRLLLLLLDEVLLSSKNIRIKHTGTPKLLPKWLGTFTILGHASHHRPREGEPGYLEPVSFKLDLPESMRVHDVFHASLLKPYVRGANVQPPPMPTVVNGEEWFDVDQILNHRDCKIHVRKATKHIAVAT
jgi:hypothetical protein